MPIAVVLLLHLIQTSLVSYLTTCSSGNLVFIFFISKCFVLDFGIKLSSFTWIHFTNFNTLTFTWPRLVSSNQLSITFWFLLNQNRILIVFLTKFSNRFLKLSLTHL